LGHLEAVSIHNELMCYQQLCYVWGRKVPESTLKGVLVLQHGHATQIWGEVKLGGQLGNKARPAENSRDLT
jgi:hypothetical protein